MPTQVPRLVCFDLDGTVMLRPNSLQYLLSLNGAPIDRLHDIDRREEGGEVDWVAADYERAPFIAGLPVTAVEEHFDSHLEVIDNLAPVLAELEKHGIVRILITSGPLEVAEALARRFTFDYCFGSVFETADGAYTGRITTHLGSRGKLDCLLRFCAEHGLGIGECAAIGDGYSDIDLFLGSGMSIGLNCADEAAAFADILVTGRDLAAVIPVILGECGRR